MTMQQEPSSPGLLRALGPFTAIAVVVGTVIGSGVFKKPQQVALHVPDFTSAALVWILGGALAILGALAYAEIVVLYPRAGGNYVFLREGYGRLAGFLWAWVEFWVIRGGAIAALATIFGESLHDIIRSSALQSALGVDWGPSPLGFWGQRMVTVLVIVALTAVNMRGVRWGGLLQLAITLVKIASLLGIMALPLLVVPALVPPASPTAIDDLPKAVTVGGFLTALLGVLWAYHGWMNIATVAEEVKNPQRNLPLALLAGVGIVVFLYLGANAAYYAVIPRAEMARMREPSPTERIAVGADPGQAASRQEFDQTVAIGFCRRLLGPIGVAVAAAAVMCSVFGALNGNLLGGPRVLFALGQDRLAPGWLAAIHPTWHTPAMAVLVLGGWAATLVLAVAAGTHWGALPSSKPHFDILTDFAMFGATTFETAAVASIFIFRRRRPDAPRPYRCWGYPVVPAIYCLVLAAVAVNMFVHQTREAAVGLGFIGLGAVAYYLTVRMRR